MTQPTERVPDADVLLVVPPLAHLSWPSLGVHLLQAAAQADGHRVTVLYANILFGARIGALRYANLSNAPGDWLLGDRLFARAAFGRDALTSEAFMGAMADHNTRAPNRATRYLDHLSDATGDLWTESGTHYALEELRDIREIAESLIDDLAESIVAKGTPIVGVTTSFDQTAAALALLAAIKHRAPQTITVLGGANCEGPMGPALSKLGPSVDHVFCGESEQTFLEFLDRRRAGRDSSRIITGQPNTDLDALRCPEYTEYFAQLLAHLPDLADGPIWLSYETSRGCWWGEKKHCTFCGLNGTGMGFRQKSPDRVIADLQHLLNQHPTRLVCMTDNIMPHSYHRTLIPRLAEEVPDSHLFYEQKANLDLAQVRGLVDAGIGVIQPGIEALSTPVLQRMRKGVLARQNVALLRYARSTGLMVKWNLLYGLPGDLEAEYQTLLELLPLLRHLTPPNALTHLSIDRFSPYFESPTSHGIHEIAPLPVYAEVFPEHADLDEIAYHFEGTWTSGSAGSPTLMAQLWNEVRVWREDWAHGQPPVLHLAPQANNQWVLVDSRSGSQRVWMLTTMQAAAVAVGGPHPRVPAAAWAVNNHFAVELDGWCVPLATAKPQLLANLEDQFPQQDDATYAPVEVPSLFASTSTPQSTS